MRYDLVVVGGGPAGVAAASAGSAVGASVALIERGLLGGTCIHRGCVPDNVMLEYAKRFYSAHKLVGGDGLHPSFENMQRDAGRVVSRMMKGVTSSLNASKVDVIQGAATLASKARLNVVSPGGELQQPTYASLVIAVGAETYRPEIETRGAPRLLTAVEAMELTAVPESIIIVLGGFLGLEWASYFHHLGSRVTVIESNPSLRAVVDPEVAGFLQALLEETGISVLVSAVPRMAEERGGRAILHLSVAGAEREVESEAIMFADFRRPALASLGLQKAGVELEGDHLVVDAGQRTTVPGILAAGDVTGGFMLANEARIEGEIAGANACGGELELDRTVIPRALHTTPEVAAVGLSPAEAEAEGYRVAVGYAEYSASARALALGYEQGVLKLVVDSAYGALLGAFAVGPQAAETIAHLAFALQMEATVDDLIASRHAHPSMSEAIVDAARAVVG
jgi:dihydrolipoamide dehydrogenase